MESALIRNLTREEGVLYALYLVDGEILGKVRLNKVLAKLQREGFPITNHFSNADMGPHDPMIDVDTYNLDRGNLIFQSVSPRPQADSDREDFRLTDKGLSRVELEILPKIETHPFFKFLLDSFNSEKEKYKSMQIKSLVNDVHEELCISEDNSEFLININSTRKMIINEFDAIKSEYSDFCYDELVLLGSLEFTSRCLNKIQETCLGDQETGKNHILVKSKDLLKAIESFKDKFGSVYNDCRISKRCMSGMNCLQRDLNWIKGSLNAIEWNSNNYGILKPFDENYELVDYMTEEEESQFTSRHLTTTTMV